MHHNIAMTVLKGVVSLKCNVHYISNRLRSSQNAIIIIIIIIIITCNIFLKMQDKLWLRYHSTIDTKYKNVKLWAAFNFIVELWT
jgi:hypothetical protein